MREPNETRTQRFETISAWSRSGVLIEREALPLERLFAERVSVAEPDFFYPLELPYADERNYNTYASYLVDACDLLPKRTDLAFDAAWKCFEASLMKNPLTTEKAVAHALDEVANNLLLNENLLNPMLGAMPTQTCSYILKRLTVDDSDNKLSGGAFAMKIDNYLKNYPNSGSQLSAFSEILHDNYSDVDASRLRQGAFLVRAALSGVDLAPNERYVNLTNADRAWIILRVVLYGARNERFHGQTFSPFLSSAGSLSTYCSFYYSFICAYSIFAASWISQSTQDLVFDSDTVIRNLDRNLGIARKVMGQYWI